MSRMHRDRADEAGAGDHGPSRGGGQERIRGGELSLVIPARNEESYLPALLASVETAQGCDSSSTGQIEVIVADNDSTDGTAEVARRHGCRIVHVPQRSIGAVRNAGAAVASGRVLCFVDADTTLHPRTFLAISDALRCENVAGGATGVRPTRWSLPLRLLSLLSLPARLMELDWGLVFCRRSAFDAIGGYREDLLAGEDIDLVFRLKRHARLHGGRLLRLAAVRTTASTRRFDDYGHWRSLALIVRLGLWRAISRRRFDDGVWKYWYEGR